MGIQFTELRLGGSIHFHAQLPETIGVAGLAVWHRIGVRIATPILDLEVGWGLRFREDWLRRGSAYHRRTQRNGLANLKESIRFARRTGGYVLEL